MSLSRIKLNIIYTERFDICIYPSCQKKRERCNTRLIKLRERVVIFVEAVVMSVVISWVKLMTLIFLSCKSKEIWVKRVACERKLCECLLGAAMARGACERKLCECLLGAAMARGAWEEVVWCVWRIFLRFWVESCLSVGDVYGHCWPITGELGGWHSCGKVVMQR